MCLLLSGSDSLVCVALSLFDESTLWRYHIDGTAPQSGWNTPEFTGEWPTSTIANLPAPQGKAMYYCASFDAPVATYATIRHTVTTRGGFAVYVNGVELGRSRLPTGDLTVATEPTSESETPISVIMGTSFAAANVKNTGNLVCIEVHTITVDTVNTFGYSVALVADEDDLVIDGDFVGSHIGYITPEWYEVAAQSCDKDIYSKFYTDDPQTCTGAVKAYVQWTWKNERMEAINYLKFYRGNEANRNPRNIAIKGSNDGENWTELVHWNTQGIWGDRYTSREFTFDNPTPYHAYRVEFWGCDYQGVEMSEFYLGTRASVHMCEEQEGYSASYIGSYARKECLIPTINGGCTACAKKMRRSTRR